MLPGRLKFSVARTSSTMSGLTSATTLTTAASIRSSYTNLDIAPGKQLRCDPAVPPLIASPFISGHRPDPVISGHRPDPVISGHRPDPVISGHRPDPVIS